MCVRTFGRAFARFSTLVAVCLCGVTSSREVRAQENERGAKEETARDRFGIWTGVGTELELEPSCAEQESVELCSNLLFWHLNAGLTFRLPLDLDVALMTSYGWSGEVDLAKHRMARAGLGALKAFRFGMVEPSVGAFVGMVVEIDVPDEDPTLETQYQYAPFVGLEAPLTLILGDVRAALVPGVSVQAFSSPPADAPFARHMGPWRADVSIRIGYFVM